MEIYCYMEWNILLYGMEIYWYEDLLVIYWICDGIYWNQCMQGYYERPWNYTDVISLDIICLYVILLEINNMGS